MGCEASFFHRKRRAFRVSLALFFPKILEFKDKTLLVQAGIDSGAFPIIPISRIGNSSHISCSSLGFPALPDCPDCVIPNPIPASPNPIPAPGAAPAPRFPWEAPFVLPGIFLCGFFQGKLGKKGVVLIQGMVRALPELQKNGGNGKKILENALRWDFGISVQDSDPCGALPA